jgi:Bax protein
MAAELLVGQQLASRLVAVTLVARPGGPRLVLREELHGLDGVVGHHGLLAHIRVDSAADLTRLTQSAATEPPRIRLGAASMPGDLHELSASSRKQAFFTALVPVVAFHRRAILDQREHLAQLQRQGAPMSSPDSVFLAEVVRYYRVGERVALADTLAALQRRVDVIPVSIAVAQAAMESGWGTSRFSRLGNNLYGQRIWTDALPGMVAAGAPDAAFRVATFPVLGASVGSYMRNLNTHAAYAEFRRLRLQMRDQGETLDPIALLHTLTSYSTRGAAYIRDLISIIEHNRLRRLDETPAAEAQG